MITCINRTHNLKNMFLEIKKNCHSWGEEGGGVLVKKEQGKTLLLLPFVGKEKAGDGKVDPSEGV